MIQRSPNHTRGRTPWVLSSSARVSVACSNSAMRLSRHSSRPRKYGELAPTASWSELITWEAFQYAGKFSGLTWTWSWVLVQAASGAMESAVTRSRSGPLMSRTMSSPAGGEDLVAEQLVAGVVAEHGRVEVLVAERRQDADHHQVAADVLGRLLGCVEAVAHALGERGDALLGEPLGRDVDLEVELPELGLEVRVAELLEDLHVEHRRLVVARRRG